MKDATRAGGGRMRVALNGNAEGSDTALGGSRATEDGKSPGHPTTRHWTDGPEAETVALTFDGQRVGASGAAGSVEGAAELRSRHAELDGGFGPGERALWPEPGVRGDGGEVDDLVKRRIGRECIVIHGTLWFDAVYGRGQSDSL